MLWNDLGDFPKTPFLYNFADRNVGVAILQSLFFFLSQLSLSQEHTPWTHNALTLAKEEDKVLRKNTPSATTVATFSLSFSL
jgi:hypothetical protein